MEIRNLRLFRGIVAEDMPSREHQASLHAVRRMAVGQSRRLTLADTVAVGPLT